MYDSRLIKLAGSAIKQAAEVRDPAPITSALQATIGRINPLTPLNWLFEGQNPYRAPATPERLKELKKHVKDMENKGYKDELEYTAIQPGGVDIVDDLFYDKARDDRPWYRRLGGRVWHNPNTSILARILGWPVTLGRDLMAPLHRSREYDPATDKINLGSYADENQIKHLLEVAALYNRPTTRKKKEKATFTDKVLADLRRNRLSDPKVQEALLLEAALNRRDAKATARARRLAGRPAFRRFLATALGGALAAATAPAVIRATKQYYGN